MTPKSTHIGIADNPQDSQKAEVSHNLFPALYSREGGARVYLTVEGNYGESEPRRVQIGMAPSDARRIAAAILSHTDSAESEAFREKQVRARAKRLADEQRLSAQRIAREKRIAALAELESGTWLITYKNSHSGGSEQYLIRNARLSTSVVFGRCIRANCKLLGHGDSCWAPGLFTTSEVTDRERVS